MIRRLLYFLLLFSALCLGGCAPGIIYTDITRPLTLDKDETPVGTDTGELSLERMVEPYTGFGIRVEVRSNAIGDAALQAGLTEIYYADIRTVSILLGLLQQHTVIVTGKKANGETATVAFLHQEP